MSITEESKVGTLYLIPTSLSGRALVEVYPESVLNQIRSLQYFVLETPKIGRSFLKGLHKDKQVSSLNFFQFNENMKNVEEVILAIKRGNSVGVMSDAGYPGIGDMGSELILRAQEEAICVRSFSGPSSILQTLAASGLNGQKFTFNGYLPKDMGMRVDSIKKLESLSRQDRSSQIFIETPYRSQYIYEDILKSCKPTTKLSLGIDIETDQEFFLTRSVQNWLKEKIDISKKQVVFIIQA